jgi:hypothetical protein
MLECSEGLADWAQHHMQEIQGIRPHVSAAASDQSTQCGHLSIWTPVITAEVKRLQLRQV